MKILRAPRPTTLDRQTSVGLVHFENGIATEFTDEQAKYFCEKQKGYVLEIIDDETPAEKTEEAAESAEQTTETKPSEPSDNNQNKISGNIAGLPSVEVRLSRSGRDHIATTHSDENGDWEFVDLNPDEKYDIDYVDERLPEQIEREIEVGVGSEISYDLTDLDSKEEELDKAVESDETTEASQDAPDGAQAAPTDTSSDEGTGDQAKDGDGKTEADDGEDHGEGGDGGGTIPPADEGKGGKTPEEKIVLPHSLTSRKNVGKFCREHGIDDQGNKRVLLERIYADKRFK